MDDEPVWTCLLDHGEGGLQVLGTPDLDRLELHAERRRGGLQGLPGNRGERVGRIAQCHHPRQLRHRLGEEFESLPLQLRRHRGQAGHIAPGSGEAHHEAGGDWVPRDGGDDGDGRRRVLGRQRAGGAGGEDDVRLETDQLLREARMAFLLALRPPVLDGEILPLHVAELPEALSKGVNLDRFKGGRRVAQIPNRHRSSGLLCRGG
jgi:hypothetical protein